MSRPARFALSTLLASIGCTPAAAPGAKAGDTAPGGADTAVEEVDTGDSPPPTAPCQPATAGSFDARPIDEARYSCEGGDCTLALPATEPTRLWARGAPAGDLLLMDAFDTPELLVATGGQVHAVGVPGVTAFSGGDDQVWMVQDEADIVAMDGAGALTWRCARPDQMATAFTVGVVGGRVLVSGLTAEREAMLVEATETGWRTHETGVSAWSFRALADDEVLQLAYGHAEWIDLSTGERILLGGSDDDFSAAALCTDGSYWLGGQTGQTMLCGADHACESVPNDAYPFQSQALGCDADGALWWLLDPGEDQATQRGALTRAGAVSYADVPTGFRTGWEQGGRRWTAGRSHLITEDLQ